MKLIVNNDVYEKEFDTVESVICAFTNADNLLRLAIEQNKASRIRAAGNQVDLLFTNLVNYEPKTSDEKQILFRFLIDRFVFEGTSDHLRRRVCERMLSCMR